MTIERYRASGGGEFVLDAITLSDGVTTLGYCPQFEDFSTPQAGQLYGIAMDVVEPSRNPQGAQSISVSIDNTTGEISRFFIDAARNNRPVTMTYRQYLSTDLTTEAEGPFVFDVKKTDFDAVEAVITASYFDVLGTAWPRYQFNLNDHPGIRYL